MSLSKQSTCQDWAGAVGTPQRDVPKFTSIHPLDEFHSVEWIAKELREVGSVLRMSEAEAATAPNRNVITRAVGLEEQVEAEIRSWVYSPGDVFLLCSDGLTDLISEPVVEEILNAQLAEPEVALASAADRLIRKANDAGGFDNISVILIRPA